MNKSTFRETALLSASSPFISRNQKTGQLRENHQTKDSRRNSESWQWRPNGKVEVLGQSWSNKLVLLLAMLERTYFGVTLAQVRCRFMKGWACRRKATRL
jgi:hypothetical protein